MIRVGVSLPALMALLGHVKAEMTMKYVQVAGTDLQREFHLARSQTPASGATAESSNHFASCRFGRRCRFSPIRTTRH